MVTTNYGKSFITSHTFKPVYSSHWRDYPAYKSTRLYWQADTELVKILPPVIVSSKRVIVSDVEIKKTLDDLGTVFISNYGTYGFSVNPAAMLGMQLFEICVNDSRKWWYTVPKPSRGSGHYEHSQYALPPP